MPRSISVLVIGVSVLSAGAFRGLTAQRASAGAAVPRFATPVPRPPLFFREEWRQPGRFDATTDFDPSFPVTPAAVTNPSLELTVYDPGAQRIPEYRTKPPPGSIPRDWTGTSCVILAGYNQNPPPGQVVHGEPSDPQTCGQGCAVRWPSLSSIGTATWT